MRAIGYFTRKLHAYNGITLYVNAIGMIIVSLLEGIGIFMLIPLVSMSGIAGFTLERTPLSGWFSPFESLPEAWRLPAALALFFLIMAGQSWLKRSVMLRNVDIHQSFVHRLTQDTYRSLLQADWLFFVGRRKSDIVNALTAELSRVSAGIGQCLQLITSAIFTLIQIVIACWLSPVMTLFVLVCGAAIAYFMRHSVKKAKALGNRSMESSKQYLAELTDQLNGMKEIKINGLEPSRLSWLSDISARRRQEGNAFMRIKTLSQLTYQIGFAALIVVFAFLSIRLFHAQMAQLMLIMLIFSRLWPRFTGIQSGVEQIAGSLSAFHQVMDLQRESREAEELRIEDEGAGKTREWGRATGRELEEGRATGPGLEWGGDKPIALQTGLACRGVQFRYQQDEGAYALRDIHVQIPAGRMTAIAGRSGAGKSTLVDMLIGLLKPESGEVLIDGTALTESSRQSLRRSVSYVPQDPFLFNGTIRDNMLLVNAAAGDDQLREALRFAAADAFVSRLPQGLDTVIGDRGVRLSGGERQRLVLARSMLRRPSILVLDEATSALDAENEATIQEAIEALKGKMTLIVIAHRLSTIRHADHVIMMEQGRVVQAGAYRQLAEERGSPFNRLLAIQSEAVAAAAAAD